jgi:HK97 gp10 family phage protein
MTTITVTIKNADEIREAFKQAPIKIINNLNKAIGRIIIQIENKAKREAPVNKSFGGGNLRQSIRSQMKGPLQGIVAVGAEYGIYVHEGTRPHEIRIVNKKVLANKRTGQIFGVRVKHPGTKPNPFLQRAVDENMGFIDNEFAKVVENIL